MPGRPMAEYVILPASVIADRKALAGWLAKALAYCARLPAKAAKTRRAARKTVAKAPGR